MILRRWLATIIWAAIILVLTSIPVPAGPPGIPGVDKAVHLFLYAVLGALAMRSASGSRMNRRTIAWTFAGVVAFGALDELHQAFLPARSADAVDLLADAGGGALGIAVVAVAFNRARAA